MLSLLARSRNYNCQRLITGLYNAETFYPALTKDLNNCMYEAIIESPFITHKRLNALLPIFENLKKRGVRVVVNTKDPLEQNNNYMSSEALESISNLQHSGIQVIFTEGHHRKLAIIDRNILWEGSLNILSQCKSIEVMRRIESTELSWEMVRFTKLDRLLH